MTAHIYPAPVHAMGVFDTDLVCLHCDETLVNVTQEGDAWPVLLCTNVACLEEPLYALISGKLVPYCTIHDHPITVCGCMEDENG